MVKEETSVGNVLPRSRTFGISSLMEALGWFLIALPALIIAFLYVAPSLVEPSPSASAVLWYSFLAGPLVGMSLILLLLTTGSSRPAFSSILLNHLVWAACFLVSAAGLVLFVENALSTPGPIPFLFAWLLVVSLPPALLLGSITRGIKRNPIFIGCSAVLGVLWGALMALPVCGSIAALIPHHHVDLPIAAVIPALLFFSSLALFLVTISVRRFRLIGMDEGRE